MATAYNIHNKLAQSTNATRRVRVDPGSGGTIVVSPVDRAVCIIESTGARTLQAASELEVGTEIMCVSTAASVTVNSVSVPDGNHATFKVGLDASGANEWQLAGDNFTAENAVTAAAAATTAGHVWVAASTDRTVETPTPVDVTGDTSAYVESIITDILGVLEAAGLITDSTTT